MRDDTYARAYPVAVGLLDDPTFIGEPTNPFPLGFTGEDQRYSCLIAFVAMMMVMAEDLDEDVSDLFSDIHDRLISEGEAIETQTQKEAK